MFYYENSQPDIGKNSLQFSSVTQSCPTLCDPIDCSMPGLPVHHQLPGLTQNSCISGRWCHPTISPSVISKSSYLQSFPASGSFPKSQFFASSGQRIRASASSSVLPMNTQDWSDWFPLGWTGWISLQSKGFSESPPIPQFKSLNYLVLSLLYGPTITSVHDYWKNHSFD